jgi:hypothetical protein
MKIFKSKKFLSAWGNGGEKQFKFICNELEASGFKGSDNQSDVYSMEFSRSIDEDLSQITYVSRSGEYPESVFNFDCSFLVFSKWLLSVDHAIFPLKAAKEVPPHPQGRAIFVLSQSHLKWNEVFSTENPCWYVSELAGYEHSIDAWIKDWRRFLLPMTQTLIDLPSVVKHCMAVQNYKANPWVRSDGYHITLAANTALLLFKNGDKEGAIQLLNQALTWQTRPPILALFQKVLNWIESQSGAKDQVLHCSNLNP